MERGFFLTVYFVFKNRETHESEWGQSSQGTHVYTDSVAQAERSTDRGVWAFMVWEQLTVSWGQSSTLH